MDTKEAREKIIIIERMLLNALMKYESETGLAVTDISIRRVNVAGEVGSRVIDVKCRIEMEE